MLVQKEGKTKSFMRHWWCMMLEVDHLLKLEPWSNLFVPRSWWQKFSPSLTIAQKYHSTAKSNQYSSKNIFNYLSIQISLFKDYANITSMLVFNCCFVCLQFKQFFKREKQELGAVERFCAGSAAGAFSQTCIYPMEVGSNLCTNFVL